MKTQDFLRRFTFDIYEDTTIKFTNDYDSAITLKVDAGSAASLAAGSTQDTSVNVGTETTLVVSNLPQFIGLVIHNPSTDYKAKVVVGGVTHTIPPNFSDFIYFTEQTSFTIKTSGALVVGGLGL